MTEPVTKEMSTKQRWLLPVRAPFLTALAAIAAIIVMALPHLNILGGGMVPVLQALTPVVCLAGLALGLGLMMFHRTRLPGLIVLVGGLVGGFPSMVPGASTSDVQADRLTVLSVNVQVGNASVSELTDLILCQKTDVVVLIEADENLISEVLSPEVFKDLPFRSRTVTAGGASGSVIMSKYALVEEADIPVPASVVAFDQPVVRVTHPQLGEFRVAAIHPFPPVAGAADWKEGLGAIRDWQNTHKDLPLIMAGDFNASYAHPVFRQVAKDLVNTASANGRIAVPTWPATGRVPAFTSIDHVLVRGFNPMEWERVSVTGTDHYGILATVTQ